MNEQVWLQILTFLVVENSELSAEDARKFVAKNEKILRHTIGKLLGQFATNGMPTGDFGITIN